jgi:hypothetical protein
VGQVPRRRHMACVEALNSQRATARDLIAIDLSLPFTLSGEPEQVEVVEARVRVSATSAGMRAPVHITHGAPRLACLRQGVDRPSVCLGVRYTWSEKGWACRCRSRRGLLFWGHAPATPRSGLRFVLKQNKDYFTCGVRHCACRLRACCCCFDFERPPSHLGLA